MKCKICKKPTKHKHLSPNGVSRVCSCKCAVEYYKDHVKPKTRRSAREVAAMVGRRSMAEVKFDAANLEGKRIKVMYEYNTFEYKVVEDKKYTPDWTLITKSGKYIYLEFKGVLDSDTRKKMKLVKQQHPSQDIRLVFERAANFIRKGSKTTYGMWADQWGFKWADNELPKEWINE